MHLELFRAIRLRPRSPCRLQLTTLSGDFLYKRVGYIDVGNNGLVVLFSMNPSICIWCNKRVGAVLHCQHSNETLEHSDINRNLNIGSSMYTLIIIRP